MRILNIAMETKAPGVLADFYQSLLELPVDQKQGQIAITIGGSRVVFTQAKNGEDPFYHFAINIPANKIEEARIWLCTRLELLWMADYHSDIADFRNWNAKSVYFLDPAGNVIELIARHDLKNQSAEPFSSAQMLSVSEIGIVFPANDINQRTETLKQQYGLNYFSRQPPFPQFKAVGDDSGLFIIVAEGRSWYPTADKPAGRFSIEVAFQVEGKLEIQHFKTPG